MYYKKDGTKFTTQIEIRRYFHNVSLPLELPDALLATIGVYKEVRNPPLVDYTQTVIETGMEWIGDEPTIRYIIENKSAEELSILQAITMAQVVQHFTNVTTVYIEGKVQAYNVANGLAFKDIDAFTKYAVTPTSVHNAIANQFISYADRLWTAVRTYQATATTIPTDEEFKAILDGVVF